ncbi:MAG: prepilin-type N-terminal cleavage/methylation domain-containing protein [Pseudomonadota bacterium]
MNRDSGFTLLELAIVLVVLGLLIGLILAWQDSLVPGPAAAAHASAYVR